MVRRIKAYEEALKTSDAGDRSLLEIFVEIFGDLDARVAGNEDQSASLTEFETALRTYGEELIDQQLAPFRAALEETAELGAVFTARSVSDIAIGTGVRTWTLLEEDRMAFAPAHMLAITATDNPAVVLWGRKIAWVKETGVLTVDVLSSAGAGIVSSWTIGPGVAAPMAAAVPMLPVEGLPALTVQAAMAEIAAALAARYTADETDDLLAAKVDSAAVLTALAGKADQVATNSALAAKAPLGSPALTGIPTAPTADPATDTGQLATTAFVKAAVAAKSDPVRANSLVINGDFAIANRSAVITASSGFVVDRWRVQASGAGSSRTVQRLADPDRPGGYLIEYTYNNSGVANRAESVIQRVEGARAYAGLPMAVSLEARLTSGARNMRANLSRNYGSGGSAAEYLLGTVAALTTEWQRVSFPLSGVEAAGKSFGTIGTDYLELQLLFAASFPAGGGPIPDFWQGVYITGASTVQIRRIQVEIGSTVSRFEPRAPAIEEHLCARYYQRVGRGLQAVARSATSVAVGGQLPVRMRAAPSMAILDTAPVATLVDTPYTAAAAALSGAQAGPDGFRLNVSGFTGLTTGQAGLITSGDLVALDAEL